MLGCLCGHGDGQHQESDSGNRRAIELNRKHHGSPWLQDLRQDVIGLECKFGVSLLTSKRMSNPPHSSAHQAVRQCRFWQLTARIPGEKSISRTARLATA